MSTFFSSPVNLTHTLNPSYMKGLQMLYKRTTDPLPLSINPFYSTSCNHKKNHSCVTLTSNCYWIWIQPTVKWLLLAVCVKWFIPTTMFVFFSSLSSFETIRIGSSFETIRQAFTSIFLTLIASACMSLSYPPIPCIIFHQAPHLLGFSWNSILYIGHYSIYNLTSICHYAPKYVTLL